jgi:hypothetical protein
LESSKASLISKEKEYQVQIALAEKQHNAEITKLEREKLIWIIATGVLGAGVIGVGIYALAK